MKILHCATTGAWAGTETMVAGLANHQAENHRVAVALQVSAGFNASFLRSKFSRKVELILVPGALVGAPEQAAFAEGALGFQPDIIHGHLGPGCRMAMQLKYPRAARIGTMHIRFFAPHFKGFDAVTAISPWQLNDIPRWFTGQKFLVENFIEPPGVVAERQVQAYRSQIHARPSTFVVGSIGRLHIEKGMDLLCKAFLRADLPDSKLVILGDGGERDRLESLVGGDPRVVFLGFVNNAAKWLPSFDLYVSAARGEPFGLTILEAMHHRVPLIATRTFGASDILAKCPERLVARDDVGGMAEVIRREYERRGQTTEYDLSLYDPKLNNEKMLEAYEQTMASLRDHVGASDATAAGLGAAIARAVGRAARDLGLVQVGRR